MNEITQEMLSSTFAQRTQFVRKAKKVTREDLAYSVGIATSTLAGYLKEDNKALPDLYIAVKIAKRLGVSLEYLCGLNNEVDFSEDNAHSAESLLKNLYRAIRDAKLDFKFDGDRLVIESTNRFIISFFGLIGKSASAEILNDLTSKHFKHIKLWNGVMVTDEEYHREYKTEQMRVYFYGDKDSKDDLYIHEWNDLLSSRMEHWEGTNGNPSKYISEQYLQFLEEHK